VGIKRLSGVLLSALMVVSLILYASSVAHAQEIENVFTVSPGEFTVRDAPPMGSSYTISQVLVLWNRDDVPRTVLITVEVPPENMVTPGYEPIPNGGWVLPSSPSFMIGENSYALIQLSLNIPRWENLTGQRWEVWIPVERQPIPGEIGVLKPTVRMKIETTEWLPPEKENELGPPPPPPPPRTTTFLTISEENFTLQAGESKYLTATLTSDGDPVEREDITWRATAGTVVPSSGETDSVGQVSIVYTAPGYEIYPIVSVSYDGSEQYEPSSGISYGTITEPSPEPEPSNGSPAGLIIGIAIVIGCAVIGAAILLARR